MVGPVPFRLQPVDTLVLSGSPGETRAASLRRGEVWGLGWHWTDLPNPVGDLYAVRVTRLAPEARGAFVIVDAQGQEGFLDLAGVRSLPHEGKRLLAQVTRAPEAGKRLTLSPVVRLAGRYLVYTPMHAGISASRQIRDKAAAQRLQGLVKSTANAGEGIIVRAAATAAESDALLAELERHRTAWATASSGDGLGNVVPSPSLMESLLIERTGNAPLTIIVDTPALQAEASRAAAIWAPAEPIAVALDWSDPFSSHGGDQAFSQAANGKIPLATGGTLWLEQTRAGWTADVDSGTAHGPFQAIRLEANYAAAVELARQIRLRQAAGLFVVDFLRLADTAAQGGAVRTLQAAFEEDPATLRFNPAFDPLGFYAFTRGRIAPPFASRQADGGAIEAALSGLRTLVRSTLADPTRQHALYLSPAALQATNALPISLRQTHALLGQAPTLLADATLGRDGYDIRPIRPDPTRHRQPQ